VLLCQASTETVSAVSSVFG